MQLSTLQCIFWNISLHNTFSLLFQTSKKDRIELLSWVGRLSIVFVTSIFMTQTVCAWISFRNRSPVNRHSLSSSRGRSLPRAFDWLERRRRNLHRYCNMKKEEIKITRRHFSKEIWELPRQLRRESTWEYFCFMLWVTISFILRWIQQIYLSKIWSSSLNLLLIGKV